LHGEKPEADKTEAVSKVRGDIAQAVQLSASYVSRRLLRCERETRLCAVRPA